MSADDYRFEAIGYLELGDTTLRNYNASIAKMVCRYGAGANSVLDFGAGMGTLPEAVRRYGITPLCLEPDGGQRAMLHERGFKTVSSLDELPDGSLDYIYSSNVLEHIEDDVSVLRTLRGKLRVDGTLFLYVPAFQSLYSNLDKQAGHFRRYDRELLGSCFLQAGFKVVDLYYADFFGYFATQVFKRIGNSMSNANSVTLKIYDRAIFPLGALIERLVRVPVGKNIVGIARA